MKPDASRSPMNASVRYIPDWEFSRPSPDVGSITSAEVRNTIRASGTTTNRIVRNWRLM